MQFYDPRVQHLIDPETLSIGQVYGLIRFVARGGHAATAWVKAQPHPDIPRLLVRHLKARKFRAGEPPFSDRTLAMLHGIDPPACRCGRPGTRIIGARTFCRHCGPDRVAAQRRAWNLAQHNHRSAMYAQQLHEADREAKARDHADRAPIFHRRKG